MRDLRHYQRMLESNPAASVGFSLAADMVYAARHGRCEPSTDHNDEWREIAHALKTTYGETLAREEVEQEMGRHSLERIALHPSHDAVVREVVDLLNNTRHTFRSKQIERARRLLQSLLDDDASPGG